MGKYIPILQKSIHTTCAQKILENSSVAVLLEASIVDALAGRDKFAKDINMLQVKDANPTDTLYRKAMEVLLGASVAHGAIALAYGVTTFLYLVMEGVALVGGVIILSCKAASLAAAPVLASEGLMGTLFAGIRAALSLRTAVAAGAAMLVFATPRASNADPRIPVAFDVSFAKFVVLKPSQANMYVGQSKTIDGAKWIVVGIARTLPD